MIQLSFMLVWGPGAILLLCFGNEEAGVFIFTQRDTLFYVYEEDDDMNSR